MVVITPIVKCITPTVRNRKNTVKKIIDNFLMLDVQSLIENFQTRLMNKGKEFVKLYLKDLASLYSLPGKSAALVLLIVEEMRKDNFFVTTPNIKKRISEKLGITTRTVDNLVTGLVNCGLLVRETSNVYMLSPYLVAYGDQASVAHKQRIFLSIKYSSDGREMSVVYE